MTVMIIGAHVPTAGGLTTALRVGEKIGAEALQIFPSAPLQWKIRGWDEEACQAFKETWQKNFRQVVFHGIYLTNLAATKPQNRHLTKQALVDTLTLAPKIGVIGTVFHPGSYTDGEIGMRDQIKAVIAHVLENTPQESKLIYENAAGSTIGSKIDDLAWLLEVSSERSRVGVCLDTCHAFAAGYDITTPEGYEAYVQEVDRKIGLKHVFCWHLNDSKFGLGEKRDRHENIGEGKMGFEPFRLLMEDSRWGETVGYLEVPGFDDKGPDAENVARLRKLRSES